MRIIKYLRSAFVITFCTIALTTSNICLNKVTAQPVATIQKEIITENLVTRMEHAAYLGSELKKAEIAMITGKEYV